jgi:protein-arginine kinase activator protein McsA
LSWNKLLGDKRDLERLIEDVKQQLTRLEEEAKNAVTLRDQVHLIEEKKKTTRDALGDKQGKVTGGRGRA